MTQYGQQAYNETHFSSITKAGSIWFGKDVSQKETKGKISKKNMEEFGMFPADPGHRVSIESSIKGQNKYQVTHKKRSNASYKTTD